MKKILTFLNLRTDVVLTWLVFILAYAFIFWMLDVRLVFSNTTVTGGDTGSHIYIPYYLKEIFPKLKWWSPDWYSGFPFLYFYPPLFYILTVILSYAISIDIAFKIIIFSIVLLYPLSFYLTLKWLGLKTPIPQLGILFSLFIIFLEKFSTYGGNLPSLLSGQFSHTASIAFLFMFCGLMYKGLAQKKYLVLNIILGSAVILSHPTSGLLLIILAPFIVFQKKNLKQNLLYVLYVYFGIFLITSFWTLSLLYYQNYAGIMKWSKEIKLDYLFPSYWLPLDIASGLGILLAIIKRDLRLFGITVLTAICSVAYFTLDNSSVWNTRFLPYVLYGILLFAAYFTGNLLLIFRKKLSFIIYLFVIFIAAFSFYTVKINSTYSAFWFKWNFEGYQVKPGFFEIDNLFTYLKSLPFGRVMWEYHPDYGKYGTPRVLETIPVFTGKPTFEGLLIESGLTGPFHFINQTETSENPTAAIAGFDYPPFDFNRGVTHLQMSGAKYFIAYSEKIKTSADINPELIKLQTVGPFNIYQIPNSNLVEPVLSFTVRQKDKDWLNQSIQWYKGPELKTPIIFAQNPDQEKELSSLSPASNTSSVSNIKSNNDSIEFDVKELNRPYLVKISYFPTWKTQGAKGPYLISPAYMMVIPTSHHVKLYFTYGWIDWLGYLLSIGGIGYLFYVKKVIKF